MELEAPGWARADAAGALREPVVVGAAVRGFAVAVDREFAVTVELGFVEAAVEMVSEDWDAVVPVELAAAVGLLDCWRTDFRAWAASSGHFQAAQAAALSHRAAEDSEASAVALKDCTFPAEWPGTDHARWELGLEPVADNQALRQHMDCKHC